MIKVGHGKAVKKDLGGEVLGRGYFKEEHILNLGTKISCNFHAIARERWKAERAEEGRLS